jgi:hypothetical protein
MPDDAAPPAPFLASGVGILITVDADDAKHEALRLSRLCPVSRPPFFGDLSDWGPSSSYGKFFGTRVGTCAGDVVWIHGENDEGDLRVTRRDGTRGLDSDDPDAWLIDFLRSLPGAAEPLMEDGLERWEEGFCVCQGDFQVDALPPHSPGRIRLRNRHPETSDPIDPGLELFVQPDRGDIDDLAAVLADLFLGEPAR